MKKDNYYKELEEKGYYDSIDKRSKDYREYKEWKKSFDAKETTGLGDVVEKVTKATGIKKVVDKVAEALDVDCGCDERKQKFNKIISWKRRNISCISEEDYKWYVDNNVRKKSRWNSEEVKRLVSVYNSVFNTKVKPSSCSSCVKGYQEALNKYIQIYNS